MSLHLPNSGLMPAFEADPMSPMLATSSVPDISLERRDTDRRTVRLNACLVPLSGADDIRCTTDNVGSGGFHATVPIGFGIAVGQRYDVVLAQPGASIGMGPLLTSSGHRATVVRTQLHVGEDGGDYIGVGLRFDRPLALQA